MFDSSRPSKTQSAALGLLHVPLDYQEAPDLPSIP